jgi:hypothetical protein
MPIDTGAIPLSGLSIKHFEAIRGVASGLLNMWGKEEMPP